ncbi:Abi family protein [Bacillus zhangzhouensis]|uniref:Abi family protein n=1 Tax=Bacillus zhangzhouensis TaxID=1178540 RepID=UPI003D1FB81F
MKGGYALVNGKSIDGLMRHLRNQHGIAINGSKQKQELLNMGYYHGYKGYRFIRKSHDKIPYSNFNEISAVYQFDVKLKTLFYPEIMLIETALKNYTLETIVKHGPAEFEFVFSRLMNSHKRYATGNQDYRKKMKNKLELRTNINDAIAQNYSQKRDVIQHFFHKNESVPLWTIFEIISMGQFGFFLSCLDDNIRIDIAKDLKIHSTSHNQDGGLLPQIVYLIKDLRNAVAHNGVIFDCRFNKADVPKKITSYLQSETSIKNLNFIHIIDYFVIVIVLLKKLSKTKTELKKIIRSFQGEVENLRPSIPVNAFTSIMGSDYKNKISLLKNYI